MQKAHCSIFCVGRTPHLGERLATGVSLWYGGGTSSAEELSGDQVFFPRANTCLHTHQIEQTLSKTMAGFEDEDFVYLNNEYDLEEKEPQEGRKKDGMVVEKEIQIIQMLNYCHYGCVTGFTL